ncbi:MAG: hypothetical protein AAF513_13775 [Pseudomonadota bacterium]
MRQLITTIALISLTGPVWAGSILLERKVNPQGTTIQSHYKGGWDENRHPRNNAYETDWFLASPLPPAQSQAVARPGHDDRVTPPVASNPAPATSGQDDRVQPPAPSPAPAHPGKDDRVQAPVDDQPAPAAPGTDDRVDPPANDQPAPAAPGQDDRVDPPVENSEQDAPRGDPALEGPTLVPPPSGQDGDQTEADSVPPQADGDETPQAPGDGGVPADDSGITQDTSAGEGGATGNDNESSTSAGADNPIGGADDSGQDTNQDGADDGDSETSATDHNGDEPAQDNTPADGGDDSGQDNGSLDTGDAPGNDATDEGTDPTDALLDEIEEIVMDMIDDAGADTPTLPDDLMLDDLVDTQDQGCCNYPQALGPDYQDVPAPGVLLLLLFALGILARRQRIA